MYVIKSGDVAISAVTRGDGVDDDGMRRTYNLGLISQGQWFGERPLLTGTPVSCVLCIVLHHISSLPVFPVVALGRREERFYIQHIHTRDTVRNWTQTVWPAGKSSYCCTHY